MNCFKRVLIILSLCLFLTNSFFVTKESVRVSANPLGAALPVAEGIGVGLATGVSAPVIAGIGATLVLAGVAWHYKDDIEAICGTIAKNVKGAVLVKGTELLFDTKKIINAYNSMKSTGRVGSIELSDVYSLPYGKLIKEKDNSFIVKLHINQSFTVPVPKGMKACVLWGCVKDFTGIATLNKDLTADFLVKGTSQSFGVCSVYSINRVKNLKSSSYSSLPGSENFITVSWHYESLNGDSICAYPNSPTLGSDCDVSFPNGMPVAGDIGNDTFVSVPKDTSVSVDSIINHTAPQVAKDFPLSIQNGQDGVSVPVNKVLNPDGSVSLTNEGTVSIPNTGSISGTGVGFLDWLKGLLEKILNAIKSIPSAILDGLRTLAIDLFVPSEGFLKDWLDKIMVLANDKFGTNKFMDNINDMKNAKGHRYPNITINWFGKTVTIVSFDKFYSDKQTYDKFVQGFIFFLLVLYNINNVYKLIRKDSLLQATTNLLNTGSMSDPPKSRGGKR